MNTNHLRYILSFYGIKLSQEVNDVRLKGYEAIKKLTFFYKHTHCYKLKYRQDLDITFYFNGKDDYQEINLRQKIGASGKGVSFTGWFMQINKETNIIMLALSYWI